MPYAILRVAKINTVGGVRSATQHITRQRETPNADPAGKVTRLDGGYRDPAEEVTRRIPEKRRKNAVLAVEHMLTVSPEWAKGKTQADIERWAQDSVQWLRDRYGSDQVAYCALHQDETTPHIHALVVPLHENKLNAFHYLGGREKLSAMQDSYAERMAPHGLERGIKGSRAHHTTVKEWYAAVENGRYQKPVKEGILDTGYQRRVEEWQKTVLAHAKTGSIALKRAREMEQTAKSAIERADMAENVSKRHLRENEQLVRVLHHIKRAKKITDKELQEIVRFRPEKEQDRGIER